MMLWQTIILRKKPIRWGSYANRLVGYSYLIRAVFSDGIIASDIINITDKSSLGEKVEKGVEGLGIAESVLEKSAEWSGQLETVIGGSLGKATAVMSKVLGIVGWVLTARDVVNRLRAPTPSDGDSNNVIGG